MTPESHPSEERLKRLEDALPESWSFWLEDAAQILKSNGTETHAAKVRGVLAALSTLRKDNSHD